MDDFKVKKVRLGNLMNLVKNRRTNQFSCNIKKTELKKVGITPAQILNINVFIRSPRKPEIINIKDKKPTKISIWRKV